MAATLGYHYVKSTHGLWLPGDERGSWSTAWDEQIGYFEPHQLHSGDPVRKRMAEERMKHPPVRLSSHMISIVIDVIGTCQAESAWRVVAASIEPTHMHLLLNYSGHTIESTAKWLAQRMTKAIHQRTNHLGPVWCKGHWCSSILDESHWLNTIRYIERHNVRRGEGARPYPFLQ